MSLRWGYLPYGSYDIGNRPGIIMKYLHNLIKKPAHILLVDQLCSLEPWLKEHDYVVLESFEHTHTGCIVRTKNNQNRYTKHLPWCHTSSEIRYVVTYQHNDIPAAFELLHQLCQKKRLRISYMDLWMDSITLTQTSTHYRGIIEQCMLYFMKYQWHVSLNIFIANCQRIPAFSNYFAINPEEKKHLQCTIDTLRASITNHITQWMHTLQNNILHTMQTEEEITERYALKELPLQIMTLSGAILELFKNTHILSPFTIKHIIWNYQNDDQPAQDLIASNSHYLNELPPTHPKEGSYLPEPSHTLKQKRTWRINKKTTIWLTLLPLIFILHESHAWWKHKTILANLSSPWSQLGPKIHESLYLEDSWSGQIHALFLGKKKAELSIRAQSQFNELMRQQLQTSIQDAHTLNEWQRHIINTWPNTAFTNINDNLKWIELLDVSISIPQQVIAYWLTTAHQEAKGLNRYIALYAYKHHKSYTHINQWLFETSVAEHLLKTMPPNTQKHYLRAYLGHWQQHTYLLQEIQNTSTSTAFIETLHRALEEQDALQEESQHAINALDHMALNEEMELWLSKQSWKMTPSPQITGALKTIVNLFEHTNHPKKAYVLAKSIFEKKQSVFENPQALPHVMIPILKHGLSLSLEASMHYLNDMYIEQVYNTFQQNIKPYYPFNPTATQDVPVHTLIEFFGKNGKINQFYTQWLEPFVSIENMKLIPHSMLGLHLPLPEKLVHVLTQARLIHHIFLPQNQPRFETMMTVNPWPQTLDNIMIKMDGRKRILSAQNNNTIIQGPIEQAMTLVFKDIGNQNHYLHAKGPWSWLHLLDQAQVTQDVDKSQFHVTWNIDGMSIQGTLTFSSSFNIMSRALLTHFTLPEHLISQSKISV